MQIRPFCGLATSRLGAVGLRNANMSLVWNGLIIGLCGTVLMDIWALALNRIAGVPMANWGNVGRWVAHLGNGKVFHDNIANAHPALNETAIGWVFHYSVGLIYGVAFVLMAGQSWMADPGFVTVLIFAIVTITAGWFLLHPGLGLGIGLSRTPNPWKARFMGLIAHTWFGVGMWFGALALAT
jgi:hypothetical protein